MLYSRAKKSTLNILLCNINELIRPKSSSLGGQACEHKSHILIKNVSVKTVEKSGLELEIFKLFMSSLSLISKLS